MEDFLNLKTSDNCTIYGIHNYVKETVADKNKKLVIFVHGYTGNCNEHIFYNASPFFNKNNFDTYRFNLYWHERDARHLSTVTFENHISDLKIVLDHFRMSYGSICLVGHSLGGQIIVRSNLNDKNIKAVVLWEPCREPKEICNELEYSEALGAYIEHSNVEIIVGKNFVNSCNELKVTVDQLLPIIKTPIKVIGAEKAGADIAQNTYFKNITSEKELFIVKNSNHTFDERGTENTLFEETLNWVTKYQ